MNPVKGDRVLQSTARKMPSTPAVEEIGSAEESTDTNSDSHSDYQPPSSSDEESSTEDDDNNQVPGARTPTLRYSRRDRRQREFPGEMSWQEVDDAGLLE